MVQHFDVALGAQHEAVIVELLVHHVPAEPEIGAVQLQHEACGDDPLVLGPHPLGHRLEIVVLRSVEFVGLEHTPKNLMLIASKTNNYSNNESKIQAIKSQFGIKKHYLETLLETSN